MTGDLDARLAACERSNLGLRRALALLATVVVALAAALALQFTTASADASALPAALRVAEIVVVDPNGVERVRIGGDLPDAVVDGRRIDRGGAAAGVLLYDRTGVERGGYVTWDANDHVGLTLDGQKSQNALFVAGPEGAAAMQVWHGDEQIELRADDNGARMTRSRSGAMTEQYPAIAALGAPTCTLFRDGLRSEVPGGLPRDQLREICQRRFSASACAACLDRE